MNSAHPPLSELVIVLNLSPFHELHTCPLYVRVHLHLLRLFIPSLCTLSCGYILSHMCVHARRRPRIFAETRACMRMYTRTACGHIRSLRVVRNLILLISTSYLREGKLAHVSRRPERCQSSKEVGNWRRK